MEVFEETEAGNSDAGLSRESTTEAYRAQPPALETLSVLWRQLNEAFDAGDSVGLEAYDQVLSERVPTTLLEQTWMEDALDRDQLGAHPWTYADLRFAHELATNGGLLRQPVLRSQIVKMLVDVAESEATGCRLPTSTGHRSKRTGTRAYAGLYRHRRSLAMKHGPRFVQLVRYIHNALGYITPMHVDALGLCVVHEAWTMAQTVVLARVPPFLLQVPSPCVVHHEDMLRFLFDAATVRFMTGAYRSAWRYLHLFWALEEVRSHDRHAEGTTVVQGTPMVPSIPIDKTIPLASWFALQPCVTSEMGVKRSELRIRAAQRYVCSELLVYGTIQDALPTALHSRSAGRFLTRYRALAEAFQTARTAGHIRFFEEFHRDHKDSFRLDGNEAWVLAVRLALGRLLVLGMARAHTALSPCALSEHTGIPASELEQVMATLCVESSWKQSAGLFWNRWFTTIIDFDPASQMVWFQRRSRQPSTHTTDARAAKTLQVHIPHHVLEEYWHHASFSYDTS
ncbi:hypothetical protein F1559_000854 [Cyanidiococcus yangmingshanensis]|uniref:Uncharacterized protein n=1 Tax=Cyanidiococcus yangmingshanensis TaxID=2690220 RepID=A0A7J7INP9_9RHOD|nr:hypothetical protein F1559_000854 [Cyanidiococcus yangmingshanensis]